jgi:hypothetical protein
MKTKWLPGLAVGLAWLAFGAGVWADPVATWKTFTDPAGRFSILMPGDPQTQDSTSLAHGNEPSSTSHLFVAEENRDLYLAGVTLYDPTAKIDVEKGLAANRDNFDQGVSAHLTSQERRKFEGYPALDFKSSGPQANFSALIVLVGTHCYMVVAAYPSPAEPPEVVRFFRSYKLLAP